MSRIFDKKSGQHDDPFINSLLRCVKEMGVGIGGTFDTEGLHQKPGDIDTVSNTLAVLY